METQKTFAQNELSAVIAKAISDAGIITKEAIDMKKAENRRLSYEAEKVFSLSWKNYMTDIVKKFSIYKNYYLAGGEPTIDGNVWSIFRMIINLSLQLVGATSPIDAVRHGVSEEANYYAEKICEAILKEE